MTTPATPDYRIAFSWDGQKQYAYDPRPDITAYELAQIVPLFAPIMRAYEDSMKARFTALPENVKRHFVKLT